MGKPLEIDEASFLELLKDAEAIGFLMFKLNGLYHVGRIEEIHASKGGHTVIVAPNMHVTRGDGAWKELEENGPRHVAFDRRTVSYDIPADHKAVINLPQGPIYIVFDSTA